jgi:hypothetical protein
MIGEARLRLQLDANIGSLFDQADVMSRDEKEDNHGVGYLSRDSLYISSSAALLDGYVTTPSNLPIWFGCWVTAAKTCFL